MVEILGALLAGVLTTLAPCVLPLLPVVVGGSVVGVPGATGRRPPLLLLDGGATHLDVSLSHHGDWIGWAFTTDPAS